MLASVTSTSPEIDSAVPPPPAPTSRTVPLTVLSTASPCTSLALMSPEIELARTRVVAGTVTLKATDTLKLRRPRCPSSPSG